MAPVIQPIERTEWWPPTPWSSGLQHGQVVARCDVYDSVDGRSCTDWNDADPGVLLRILEREGWDLHEGHMVCPRHG